MIQHCDRCGREYDLDDEEDGAVEMVNTTGMSPAPDNINLCQECTTEWNHRKAYERSPNAVRQQYDQFIQERSGTA
jgi:NMD protein affecting ribosome stability and mRNA decay